MTYKMNTTDTSSMAVYTNVTNQQAIQTGVTFISSTTELVTTLSTVTLKHATTTSWTSESIEHVCRQALCTKDFELKFYPLCEITYVNIVSGIEFFSNHLSSLSKVILSVVLSLIMLTSVCGNSLVVMTFVLNRHMRSVTNVFILSLAASDLMVAFTCVPLNMANELTSFWEFGKFACKLFAFISQFSVACSSLTLCCIAFDRYYAVVHPLRLKFLQTPRRAAILQVIVLLISAASSLAYAFFFDLKKIPICDEVEEEVDQVCIASDTKAKKIFDVWITLIVLLCGPFVFMSITYGIICYTLWAPRPILARHQSNTDRRIKLKRRVVKMLITVVCIFAFCRSPLILFNAIAEVNHLANNMSNVNWRAYLQCLSLSSACLNPIVYAFMNEKFRKSFTVLLKCKRAQVYPVAKRGSNMRASTESRKTTTQLELPAIPANSQNTSETRA